MKHVEEYRDPDSVLALAKEIKRITTKPWTIMEICGGQTHSIVRFGIDELLPDEITLVHGPGCPVCVTGVGLIDKAIELARRPEVIFCSFGDMMRVPGSEVDLLTVKAEGGDVRMVYSPMDALQIAEANPDKEVLFFAVGFETTAPATAMTVAQAKDKGINNFSLLVAHVLVPPAMEAILSMPGTQVQGFLAAGHVCAVTGYEEYHPIADKYGIPIVVTGFEPVDILQGMLYTIRQLEAGQHIVENTYSRIVRPEGNLAAMKLIGSVFGTVDRSWRGIGEIPSSGWGLREEYHAFDAERKFNLGQQVAKENPICLSGKILQGVTKPHECPAFGTLCTPEHPLGATMVSSEGACAAYYKYRRTTSTTS